MTDRYRMAWRMALGAVLALALVIVGCSVPEDSEPQVLGSDILPQVATPTPAEAGTVTVRIYLFSDDTGLLFPVTREVETPVTVAALLSELTEPVTAEEGENNLTSPMPETTALVENGADVSNGLAILDLVATGLPDLQDDLLLEALAQLVWTLTEPGNGIDRIVLKVEGEDTSWPSSRGDTTPAQRLTREDYFTFDPDFVEPAADPDATTVPIDEGDATPIPGG